METRSHGSYCLPFYLSPSLLFALGPGHMQLGLCYKSKQWKHWPGPLSHSHPFSCSQLHPPPVNFTHLQTVLNMALFQTIVTPTVTYEQPLGLYVPKNRPFFLANTQKVHQQ
jgi:hypothetical protein